MSKKKLTLKEVQQAIIFDQPKLEAFQEGSFIIVQGQFLILKETQKVVPSGPITTFEIKIVINNLFPYYEPKVYETTGRIPRLNSRHINDKGDCCITVWEEWLTSNYNLTFTEFMNGPLRNFFLSQYWFEKTGEWPFGERPHYEDGLLESYSDILKISNNKNIIIYYLRLLSQKWPKGHWLCPCASSKPLRYCHKNDLSELHKRIPPYLAKRMLQRLRSYNF